MDAVAQLGQHLTELVQRTQALKQTVDQLQVQVDQLAQDQLPVDANGDYDAGMF